MNQKMTKTILAIRSVSMLIAAPNAVANGQSLPAPGRCTR